MSNPWIATNRGDLRAFGISRRHYSITNKRPKVRQFIQSGSPMVLLTPNCDALFVWVENTIERYDKQEGINCAMFRNEGPTCASQLVRWAVERARERWPTQRLWTYCKPTLDRLGRLIRWGRCFLEAGWLPWGVSKEGLLIWEVPA